MLDTLAFNSTSVKAEVKLAIGGKRLVESKEGLIDLIPNLEEVPEISQIQYFSAGRTPESVDDLSLIHI